MPAEQFVHIFCEKLEILRQHSFIASQQAAFYNNCKTSLHPRECLVTVDIAENYTLLQDAAQVFHWNNSQAKNHPFVAYFVDSGELCHLS